METGYKSLRKRRIRQRTQTRTQRGREPGSKNNASVAREILEREAVKKGALLINGKLAVEIMDEEIAAFEALMRVLYPWDEAGAPIKGKSIQSYYWASEMRRDYLALRAPYQSPRLSAVQVVTNQPGKRITEVNVTILNEKGDQEYSDVPDEDMKLIEGITGQEPTMGDEPIETQEPSKDQGDEAA